MYVFPDQYLKFYRNCPEPSYMDFWLLKCDNDNGNDDKTVLKLTIYRLGVLINYYINIKNPSRGGRGVPQIFSNSNLVVGVVSSSPKPNFGTLVQTIL